ncbi:DUF2283 domain-containing protein [Candidatus Microgenomates bacterium]|nr:DUF2283 domain-containing protein [Candidatus Microgenomates bacterium]
MRITYDKSADAVYIYLKEKIEAGGVNKTYPCDPKEVDGMINLDFDIENKLIGIEILGASRKLPKELLDKAERLDK